MLGRDFWIEVPIKYLNKKLKGPEKITLCTTSVSSLSLINSCLNRIWQKGNLLETVNDFPWVTSVISIGVFGPFLGFSIPLAPIVKPLGMLTKETSGSQSTHDVMSWYKSNILLGGELTRIDSIILILNRIL